MNKILLIGAGNIGRVYLKILFDLGRDFTVVVRNESKASILRNEYPNVDIRSGGVQSINTITDYTHAIISTQIEYLAEIAMYLIKKGIKYLLVEKPLTYKVELIDDIIKIASSNDSLVYVAFNRRNYRSVEKAKEIINKDGGLSSVKFDFTEAIFRIDETKFSAESKFFWGIANSSHVIDTVFYLTGYPNDLTIHQSGNGVEWHSSGSIFMGMGTTDKGVPFSYHADWGCPGRWSIEIQTPKRKLIFSPMEILKEQKAGTFAINEVEIDYKFDLNYKPGFFHQTKAFLGNRGEKLMEISELRKALPHYYKIFGYTF